jgi:hypothetical protein
MHRIYLSSGVIVKVADHEAAKLRDVKSGDSVLMELTGSVNDLSPQTSRWPRSAFGVKDARAMQAVGFHRVSIGSIRSPYRPHRLRRAPSDLKNRSWPQSRRSPPVACGHTAGEEVRRRRDLAARALVLLGFAPGRRSSELARVDLEHIGVAPRRPPDRESRVSPR